MKVAFVAFATAFAIKVFPVPGGPTSRTPFGGSTPTLLKLSGFSIGNSTVLRNSSNSSTKPPISEYFSAGFSSTSAPITSGSLVDGRVSRTARVCLCKATRSPTSNFFLSIPSEI